MVIYKQTQLKMDFIPVFSSATSSITQILVYMESRVFWQK